MIRTSRHSMLMGASATRGGFTFALGAAVRPVRANSSTSGGQSPDVRFMCSPRASSTTLTTNSRVASTLRRVSFLVRAEPRSPRSEDEKAMVGGSSVMAMK